MTRGAMSGCAVLAVTAALLTAGCGSTVPSQPSLDSGFSAAGTASSPATGDSGLGGPASGGGESQGTRVAPRDVSSVPAVTGRQSSRGGGPVSLSSSRQGAPSPIRIGFYNQNNASLNSEYGYSVPQGEDIDKALVTAINSHGGLAGHPLRAHFVTYSAESHDFASDAAAACQTFTVDTPVRIVFSPTVSTSYGFADCLQRKGVLLESSWPTDDRSFATHPLMFSASASTFEHGYLTTVDQLHASGYLTSKTHLGVFLENCPENARAWSAGIQPEIRRLGVPAELSTLSCTSGIQDAGTDSAAMQSAILKWRGAGVDRVMFVTPFESTLLVLFAPAAESQQFRPGYVLTSGAGASSVASGSSFPTAQKPGLHGAGTIPGYDVDHPPAPSPVESRCIALARTQGVQMTDPFDRSVLYTHCASLFLFEVAFKRLGPAPANPEVRLAIEGLGSHVLLPGLIDDRADLAADRHDAPAYAREFGWRSSCSCLAYLGPARMMSG